MKSHVFRRPAAPGVYSYRSVVSFHENWNFEPAPGEVVSRVNEIPEPSDTDLDIRKFFSCTRCHLAETRDLVSGIRGDASASVLVLGDAPTITESISQEPFSHSTSPGRIQTAIMKHSGVAVENVAFANVIGCRACNARNADDRVPTLCEQLACSERLLTILKLIRPRIIVTVGNAALGCFVSDPEKVKENTWLYEPVIAPNGEWFTVGYTNHPKYLERIGAGEHTYYEWTAAILFYKKLAGMLSGTIQGYPQVTRLNEWTFKPLWLSQAQQSGATITSGAI